MGAKCRQFCVFVDYLRIPLSLPFLSRFHFGQQFLPAILLQRGTNWFLRIGDDQLLFTSFGHDTQTNQSPVTCRASQAAPTDPLRPHLTDPQPLQTPLTTGAQPQPLRHPKDLQGRIPPRVAPRPLPVNMKAHLPQHGRPPYMLRVTRWVSVHAASSQCTRYENQSEADPQKVTSSYFREGPDHSRHQALLKR